MAKVFLDTDIILDLLTKRYPFYHAAARLFTKIDEGMVMGYASPLIFSNLYYILRKQHDSNFAIKHLQKLKLMLKLVPITERTIELALASDFKDFEDAIHYYAARDNDIPYLITRNVRDYKSSRILTICTAEEFLDVIAKI